MDIAMACGACAGMLAGLGHATFLWRTAHSFSVWTPLWGLLRMALVASVLVISALCGQILAAALGWLIGVSILGGWLVCQGRQKNNFRI